jgi:predicted ferric reductase
MWTRVTWFGVFGVSAFGPALATIAIAHPAWRTAAIELSVAAGYVALALFVLQFATTGRFRAVSDPWRLDGTMRIHRATGIVSVALFAAHPLVLVAVDPAYLSFLDPRVNFMRAGALSAAILAAVWVAAGRTISRRIGIDHGWWRLSHGLAALLLVAVGAAHVVMVGHHTNTPWKIALWIGAAIVAAGLLVWTRVGRPWRVAKTPWRVADVERVADRTWVLALEAEGHAGLVFQPGQFAWITIAASPWSIEQHPFSLASSSERPARIEFAIKELGDFTAAIGSVARGQRAFVDGPYGAFDLPRDPSVPIVMLAGGIGIAPFLGMLRTMKDRGERRRVLVVYGAARIATLAFRAELEAFATPPEVEVVVVLEEPDDAWDGERGVIDEALLARVVPRDLIARARFFACGPPPMLAPLGATLAKLGVARSRYTAERFDVL